MKDDRLIGTVGNDNFGSIKVKRTLVGCFLRQGADLVDLEYKDIPELCEILTKFHKDWTEGKV